MSLLWQIISENELGKIFASLTKEGFINGPQNASLNPALARP